MRKKWRCSKCAICDWIDTDHYSDSAAVLTALGEAHQRKSPYCSQEAPDIFGEVHGPFSAPIMPYLDSLERDIKMLEQSSFAPDKVHIAVLKDGLLTVDHVLTQDGLSVEAGKRIAELWRRVLAVQKRTSDSSGTSAV